MGYDLREHTADVAVEASGETPGAAFAHVADGMTAAMCEDPPDVGGDRYTVSVSAESREALLFDYLDELIYERDVRSVLPVDNTARVEQTTESDDTGHSDDGTGEWRVEGSFRGVSLARVDARDLKAVTYSEMALEQVGDGWRAYVVFDV
jgi:SHS2 domain-containing protein